MMLILLNKKPKNYHVSSLCWVAGVMIKLRLSILFIDKTPPKNDAIMKHNSARRANTMEFPIGKFAMGSNTMVKTIYSRWRP
jgi:hypothetical protein